MLRRSQRAQVRGEAGRAGVKGAGWTGRGRELVQHGQWGAIEQ